MYHDNLNYAVKLMREIQAQTCLFLSSKVEESTRRIRGIMTDSLSAIGVTQPSFLLSDILNVTYRLHYPERPPLGVTDVRPTLKGTFFIPADNRNTGK